MSFQPLLSDHGVGSVRENGNGKPRPQQQQQTKKLNTTIPKKKKKGKSIVPWQSRGFVGIANDEGRNYNMSDKMAEHKIPRKPRGTNTNNKPNTMTNTHTNNWKGHRQENKNRNSRHKETNKSNGRRQDKNYEVLAMVKKDANIDAIRKALDSELPQKLKSALGTAKLELNQQREFVIRKEPGTKQTYSMAKRLLKKNNVPGWLPWLQGRRGWVIACDKSPYLGYHRKLHEAYTQKWRALKEANPSLKKNLNVLYYKQDPRTLEIGGSSLNGTRQNTQTIWKKVSEQESLQDTVGKIRPFLEVVQYFCNDPEDKWKKLPWLTITREECDKRLNKISNFVSDLMRSSKAGPDAPVHWAAHSALNVHPRSVVTPSNMTELVVGVANILSHLLLSDPIIVSNLKEVDRLLPEFSSVGDGVAVSASKKSSPPKNSKNTTGPPTGSSYHRPHKPSSDSVEDLIIDLTDLSI